MKKIPRTVLLLGLVSFFNDFSSEMVYPLLPVFLSSLLGAGLVALGLIEGVAEATASLLKVVSGLWTDAVKKRKPLIVSGYGLAGLVRPLIGIARSWPFVFALRFFDRVGKGLRTSPRDALIADVTPPEQRGTAYGFHRAMDHTGAVVGPLVAALLLMIPGFGLRKIFLLTAIPGVIALLILLLGLKEDKKDFTTEPVQPFNLSTGWRRLTPNFKFFLLVLFLFALGNSTDAFLILRLSKAGVTASGIALLWSLHHLFKSFSTYWGGRFSDKIGPRPMILIGWIFYAAVYLAFAVFQSPTALITIFLAYGVYFGLVEPAERALVSRLVPPELRGTGFGFYHFVVGIAAFPASLIFGLVWQQWGAASAFLMGASLAFAASVLLFLRPIRV
ncbi:MAG: MFS transporter [Deltaproteobacteria bacterium]|nr:MFS transporter [Deltaproteobacteria bacterium]